MNKEPLYRFLSEKGVDLHEEYLNTERAKLSILEKSLPSLSEKSLSEIYTMRHIKRADKEEVLTRISNIRMHEIYFSSFTESPLPCQKIKEYYTSESAFLYEAWLLGREKKFGFLYFYLDRRGKPCFDFADEGFDAFLKAAPLLAVDLCEHAYFLDYGFDSGEYLRRALGFLDIARLVAKS